MDFVEMMRKMGESPDGELYKDCLFDMIGDCAGYVGAVVEMEACKSDPEKGGAEYREKLSSLDKRRTIAHNSLISKIQTVNRICQNIGIEPVCADNLARAEYGDYAFSVVRGFFENRTR